LSNLIELRQTGIPYVEALNSVMR